MQKSVNDPYYNRLHTFLEATSAETERGRALVAASLIEEMLEEVLRAHLLNGAAMNRLFEGPNAPFSSLSAKAAVSRSLALISIDEFRDIELVRKIRNEFAHSVMCSFDDPIVRDRANLLKVGMVNLDALEEGHKSRVDDPRQRFGMVVTSLVSALYNRANWVREACVKDRVWPA